VSDVPGTELHVHDWSPWGPSPLDVVAGVERHRRVCRGCGVCQDEPTPETPSGLVPDSAIEAAAAAISRRYVMLAGRECRAYAELALAAAVPHIERAIRDGIAAELTAKAQREARAQDYFSEQVREATMDALLVAAAVVRGGEATE